MLRLNIDETFPSGSELDAARRLHRYHVALVEAGFSEAQALELLIALIVA